ncbi:MAG: type I 3-dehydroquinate dehydratase [Tidjanibacter sp.]|nr:type I 3-dehydroquinate dehydratase [Tidjanibacter sp.]
MIFCISISNRSIEGCLRQMEGAEMVELRADLAGFGPEQVAAVVAKHPNVMLTWHTTPESEPTAEAAIEAALGAGARWVDVEIHASEGYRKRIIEKAHRAGAKVVISFHDYSATPTADQLVATTKECFALGADIAKVITTAHSTAEGATTLALYDHFEPQRLIAFAMGAEGAFTRRLSLLLGAPWTYVAPSEEHATAPGQLTAQRLGDMLRGGEEFTPAGLPHRVSVPATKSAAQRAVVCAMLAEGESVVENFAVCGDSLAALRVAEEMGCEVEQHGDTLHIKGVGAEAIRRILNNHSDTSIPTIHTGESGLLTRLLLPLVAALSTAPVRIGGHGTLTRRNLGESIEALRRAEVAEVEGSGEGGLFVPIEVRGPIGAEHIVIDGSRSSQVASGLMIALPLLPNGATLTIENPTSLPYLHLTEQVMAAFGCPLVRTEGCDHITYQAPTKGVDCPIKGLNSSTSGGYSPTSIRLEADWSSAAYFAAAFAVAQSGTAGGRWQREEGYLLEGMATHTAQADELIVEVLRHCGAHVVEEPSGALRFMPSSPLRPLEVDASNSPDLIPTLAVVALFAEGTSRIGGLHRLATKESNRTEAVLGELKALGAKIGIEGDQFVVAGSCGTGGYALHAPIGGAPLHSHADHRMVMSLAIVSLFAEAHLTIDSTAAVGKSFPSFFSKFQTPDTI